MDGTGSSYHSFGRERRRRRAKYTRVRRQPSPPTMPDRDRAILATRVIVLTTILLVSNSFLLFGEPLPTPHHGVIQTTGGASPGPGRRARARPFLRRTKWDRTTRPAWRRSARRRCSRARSAACRRG